METGPQESSSTFGSLTARELPLLKIFVFVMICSYLDGYTVKKKAGTLRFAHGGFLHGLKFSLR
jgi:hypothetical protein